MAVYASLATPLPSLHVTLSRSLPVPAGLNAYMHDSLWYTARRMWIYLEVSPRTTHHTRQGTVPASVVHVPIEGLL